MSATDADGDTAFTFAISTPPQHGTVTCDGATCSYTPSADFNGSDSFAYTATDNAGASSTPGTVSVTVTAVDDPPVASMSGNATLDEDSSTTLTLSATDVDGDAITGFSVVTTAAHGSVSLSGTSVTYTPGSNFNGTDSFAVVAETATSDSAPLVIELTIRPQNDPPVGSFSGATTVDEDGTATLTLSATDVDSSFFFYSLDTLPQHGVAAIVDDELTYLPASNYFGPDTLTFIANDGGADSAPVTIDITISPVDDPPVASFGGTTTLDEDTSAALTLSATDIEGDAISGYSVSSAPVSGSVAIVGSVATYTPNVDFNGNDSFSFIASANGADSAPVSVSLTVSPVNDAPVMTLSPPLTTNEDTLGSVTVGASDIDGDTLAFSAANGVHGTASCSGTTCSYTPESNWSGTDSFVVTVSDGHGGSDTATISVTVDAVNDAPVMGTPAGITTDEDTTGSTTVSATDVEGDTVTFAAANGAHGTASCTGTTCSYVPDADWNGTDSFVVTVSDGNGGSDTATVSVTVSPVNDAPVAGVTGSTTLDEDTSRTLTLTATDVDSSSFTYAITASPTHGTLDLTGDQAVYTPDANWNGSDGFSFTANDGSATSSPLDVTLTVSPVNDAPVMAAPAGITTDEDTVGSTTVSATDLEGDSITFSAANGAHGTASCTGTTCSYTPDADWNGTDSFVVTASDGNGGSDTATVNVTVSPVNDAPVITTPLTIVTDEDVAGQVTVSVTDVDGDAVTLTAGSASHGTTGCAGTLCWIVTTYNWNGTDSFVITASDGHGGTDSATVSVTVNPVNDDPGVVVYSLPASVFYPGETVPVSINAYDPDGDPVSVLWEPADADSASSFITHPHARNQRIGIAHDIPASVTQLNFRVTVSDPSGATASATVPIPVASWAGSAVRLPTQPFRSGVYGTLSAVYPDVMSGAVIGAKEYAFLLSSNGLLILDITDPTAASVVYAQTGLSRTWKGPPYIHVNTSGDVLVVAVGNAQLFVWNITDPTSVTYSILNGVGTYPTGVVAAGDYAYVGDQGFIRPFNIADPAAPLGGVDCGGAGVDCVALALTTPSTYGYVGSNGSATFYSAGSTLNVLDTTTPNAPTRRSGLSSVPVYYLFAASGNLLAVSHTTGVDLYDTSDLDALASIGPVSDVIGSGRVAFDGNTLFLASSGWLQTIDVSNPVSPVSIGITGANAADGYPYAHSGGRYVLTMHRNDFSEGGGFDLHDRLATTLPGVTASLPFANTNAGEMVIAGQNLLAASGDSGAELRGVDISTPSAPALDFALDTVNLTRGLKLQGRRLYASGNDHFDAYDISDVTAPSLLGRLDTTYALYGFAIDSAQSHAYVCRHTSIEVFDIADPTAMSVVQTIDDGGAYYNRAALYEDSTGAYVYAGHSSTAGGGDAFDVTDLSAPITPSTAPYTTGTSYLTDVQVRGDKVYSQQGNNLEIHDLAAAPSAPALEQSLNLRGTFKIMPSAVDVVLAGAAGVVARDVHAAGAPLSGQITGIVPLFDVSALVRYGNNVWLNQEGTGISGVMMTPTLNTNATTVSAGSTVSYGVSWQALTNGADLDVLCFVVGAAGESCAVSAVDNTAHTATVDWTVSTTPGDYEIVIMVGNTAQFVSTKDRLQAL